MVLFQGALPIDERSSMLFAAVLACHHMLWLVNKMHDWLVVWKIFFHMLGIIIPTDELIFFRAVAQPPTTVVV
jgi:hypothetical protein